MSSATETDTRFVLMRHAARLFAERGYDAVSVREIVEASGLTKPALYYHFGSKEGIARALMEEFTTAALAVRDGVLKTAATPDQAFVAHATGMLTLAVRYRDTLAFGFSLWFGRTSLQEVVAECEKIDKESYALWTEFMIDKGMSPGLALVAVKSYWAMVFLELMAVVGCPDWQGNPSALARQIAAVTLRGVTGLKHDEVAP